jgi:hypothetical protein
MLLDPSGSELCQEVMDTQLSGKLLPSSSSGTDVTVFMLRDYAEVLRSGGLCHLVFMIGELCHRHCLHDWQFRSPSLCSS